MSRLPSPRNGETLIVNEQPVKYTYWPIKSRGKGRPSLQTQIFTNDPLNVIESSINQTCPRKRKEEAFSYLDQAKDYLSAIVYSRIIAAKPILSYYAMLNIVKSYILTYGIQDNLGKIQHGIYESNSSNPHFSVDELKFLPSKRNNLSAFAELYRLLTGVELVTSKTVPVSNLFAQTILGHRLWCSAANQNERFIQVARIQYVHNAKDQELWLRLYFYVDDLKALGITHQKLLTQGRFQNDFQEIGIDEKESGRQLISFEQITPVLSSKWPSDKLGELSCLIKNNLWNILLNAPPYRRFYAYIAPTSEHIFPQLISIYALAFYFGSITRYHPHKFKEILETDYGAYVREFIDYQIIQFLFLIAGEFSKRDVVKPSVI